MNKIIIRKDPKMQYNKHPKTIWITGASSGIGQEFARQFARKGDCRLILTARRKDRLHALADSLSCPCRIEPADLSVPEECECLLAALSDETIDIFINNAGLGTCGNFLETDLEKERTMLRVNVEAMHILFKQVLCQMQKKKRGTIVNVASSAGLFPGGPFMASYYATKSYTVSLTLAVAEELRQKKSPVYVCALCPGPVNTEFNEHADVRFALPGISAERCVREAFAGMHKRKLILVPGFFMRLGCSLQKLLPNRILLPLVAKQQMKKQKPHTAGQHFRNRKRQPEPVQSQSCRDRRIDPDTGSNCQCDHQKLDRIDN